MYHGKGLSCPEIGALFETGAGRVRTIMIEHGIPRRTGQEYTRKYPVNHNYFDKIDSEDTAYFLGLLYADGNISSCKNSSTKRIKLTLQDKDKHILESLTALIQPTKPLNKVHGSGLYKDSVHWQMMINSDHMAKILINYGCVERKSLILKFPEWLADKELQRHFLRGYFDGDGTINKSPITPAASFLGTKDFCEYVKEKLLGHGRVRLDKNKTYKFCVAGGVKCRLFLSWLYLDSKYFLKRKKARAIYQILWGLGRGYNKSILLNSVINNLAECIHPIHKNPALKEVDYG